MTNPEIKDVLADKDVALNAKEMKDLKELAKKPELQDSLKSQLSQWIDLWNWEKFNAADFVNWLTKESSLPTEWEKIWLVQLYLKLIWYGSVVNWNEKVLKWQVSKYLKTKGWDKTAEAPKSEWETAQAEAPKEWAEASAWAAPAEWSLEKALKPSLPKWPVAIPTENWKDKTKPKVEKWENNLGKLENSKKFIKSHQKDIDWAISDIATQSPNKDKAKIVTEWLKTSISDIAKDKPLSKNNAADWVRNLQSSINEYMPADKKIKVDWEFWPKTLAALKSIRVVDEKVTDKKAEKPAEWEAKPVDTMAAWVENKSEIPAEFKNIKIDVPYDRKQNPMLPERPLDSYEKLGVARDLMREHWRFRMDDQLKNSPSRDKVLEWWFLNLPVDGLMEKNPDWRSFKYLKDVDAKSWRATMTIDLEKFYADKVNPKSAEAKPFVNPDWADKPIVNKDKSKEEAKPVVAEKQADPAKVEFKNDTEASKKMIERFSQLWKDWVLWKDMWIMFDQKKWYSIEWESTLKPESIKKWMDWLTNFGSFDPSKDKITAKNFELQNDGTITAEFDTSLFNKIWDALTTKKPNYYKISIQPKWSTYERFIKEPNNKVWEMAFVDLMKSEMCDSIWTLQWVKIESKPSDKKETPKPVDAPKDWEKAEKPAVKTPEKKDWKPRPAVKPGSVWKVV